MLTEEELNKIKEKYPEFKGSGRCKNLTNLYFGELLVLYRFDEKGGNGKCAQWVCQCSCGNIRVCDAGRLNSKSITHCGCKTKELISTARKKIFNDLTGKIFGELTVIKHIDNPKNTGALFECLCSCGNIRIVKGGDLSSGSVKKCKDCVKKQQRKSKGSSKNLIGQKFGTLTVLKETSYRTSGGDVKWECKCDCGEITYIPTNSLTSGNSTTCGASIHKAKDWTGHRFGKLTALEIINKQDNAGHFYWKCQCDCGNIIQTTTHSLVTGRSQSCGCVKSRQEEKIAEMLSILYPSQFLGQKGFDSLGAKKFDFFVNNKYIIEYDGEQHFKDVPHWGSVKNVRKNDLIKNKYCFDNNIPLIRIPYNVDYTIDDLRLETTRFLLTPENEQDYYNKIDKINKI